jgi:hypothetical protein
MSATDILSSFQGNSAVSLKDLADVEKTIGFELPSDYKQFLMKIDGGEGFIGDGSYLILWRASELHGFNVEYESASYCPNVLLIGSNGGGEAFGIDKERGELRYVQVPFVGMSRSSIEVLSTTFEGFLKSLGEMS